MNGTSVVSPPFSQLKPSSFNTFSIKNAGSGPVDITSVRLFENINNVDVEDTTLVGVCKYIALGTDSCLNAGAAKSLPTGESCDIGVNVANKFLTGYLVVETSAGQLKWIISVAP